MMSREMSDTYGNLEGDTVPLCLCSVNLSSCKITKHLSPGFQGRFGMSFPESVAGWETQKSFYWRLPAKVQMHGQSSLHKQMQLLLFYQRALKQRFGVVLRIKAKHRIEELPVCQHTLSLHQQVIWAQQEWISTPKQFVLRPLCFHNRLFQGFTLDQIQSGPQIKCLPYVWCYISQRISHWYRLQCPHQGLEQMRCKPRVKI